MEQYLSFEGDSNGNEASTKSFNSRYQLGTNCSIAHLECLVTVSIVNTSSSSTSIYVDPHPSKLASLYAHLSIAFPPSHLFAQLTIRLAIPIREQFLTHPSGLPCSYSQLIVIM